MMFTFILGMILVIAGFGIPFMLPSDAPNPLKWLIRTVAPAIGLVLIVVSTAIYVEDDQAGVVVVKFGSDLPVGQIIATNGEKGPQAKGRHCSRIGSSGLTGERRGPRRDNAEHHHRS